MSDQANTIIESLGQFGLSSEEAKTYVLLLESGPMGALQISRKLKIGRTKIYRITEKLHQKGLVNGKIDDQGLKFEALSYRQLEVLAKQKEVEALALKKSVPELFGQLANIADNERSRVIYYTGIEGLKQVTLNSLEAQDELRLFEIKDMSQFLNYGYAEEVRKEFVRRKVKIRELTNQTSYSGWTKVKGLVGDLWTCRYIDPKQLEMKFEMLVYNDVYALYSFKGEDIFCVEVKSKQLAEMQKQIFDYLWLNAKPMKILDDEGASKVE
jgi:sugar-specific transcriptional regulator TrmB